MVEDSGSAWLAAMRRGDFRSAWDISDRVLAERVAVGPCWHLPRHEQWVWDGRPLADQRVLVRSYHGLGDTIMFARFLPLVCDIAREVIVWAPPPLLPLLHTLSCSLELLPLHDGAPEVHYDVDIELMELPHALRVTLATLPAAVPYFNVCSAPRLCDGFSVGLLARAGEWDADRSLPAEVLAATAKATGARCFNLQLEPAITGIDDISTPEIVTLASRVRALDLVIAVDTMVAHLAGALAVPTWLLLKADADWRWMVDRSDSPWYPTMRLFRQPSAGDWTSVVARVQAALEEAMCAR